ncbi:hypothetical protein [Kaarinaea lacus]
MNYGVRKKYLSIMMVIGLLLLLAGCAGQEAKKETGETASTSQSAQDDDAEKGVKGTLLIYTEREAGSNTESFTTRIFVSHDFLHLSNSFSPADYVLFNRSERTIYNVTQEDKSIFVINDKPHNKKPPISLDYETRSQPSSAIPKIDGRQATHYRFFVNDKHCYDSVVLGEKFLPDVLNAMREFREVLANEHAATVNKIPVDMLDACDLAINVFHATRHMENGLPIREWDRRGYQRFLKDYRQDVSVPEEIFVLPEDFSRFSLDDLQSSAGR